MKIYLVQDFSGEHRLYTVDGHNITYCFNPKRQGLLYLQSYTSLRSKREPVSLRIVTISSKGSSEKVAVSRKLSEYEFCLRCMITTDSNILRFEQGLSFQASRK
jgi:hypothetical protein